MKITLTLMQLAIEVLSALLEAVLGDSSLLNSQHSLPGNKPKEWYHTKTGLNIVVVAIPKGDWAGLVAAKPSFCMMPTIELYSFSY